MGQPPSPHPFGHVSNRTCVLTNTQLLLHVVEGRAEVEELGTRVIKNSQHGFIKEKSCLTNLTTFCWLGR